MVNKNKVKTVIIFLFSTALLTACAGENGENTVEEETHDISENLVNIRIIPNENAIPNSEELVTFGVPFPPCTLLNRSDFRLLNESEMEVPIFVKETISWGQRNDCQNSIRAIKVQFKFDATDGEKQYKWSLGGRNVATDITEESVYLGEIMSPNTSKAGFHEPRVFAITDPDYLVTSRIIPPTVPITTEVYDTEYYPNRWISESEEYDYTVNSAANWLFDRVTTNYRQAIRRGELSHYREAYVSRMVA